MKILKCKISLLFIFLSVIFVSIIGLTAVSSNAQINNSANSVAFSFEEGASVRMVSNSSGLRFRAFMSVEEYDALEANSNYSELSYGMIILPLDYHLATPVNKESVFGSSATYTIDSNASGKTYVLNFTSDFLYDYFEEGAKRVKCISGAITNIKSQNYVREFVAVSYIKTTLLSGQIDYIFTDVSDARSVVYVSQIAIQNNVSDSDDILSGFVDAAKNIDTEYTVDHYKNGVKQEALTQTLTAKIGSKITPEALTLKGYSAQSVEEKEILANGKTIFRIDYDKTDEPTSINLLTDKSHLDNGNIYSQYSENILKWYSGTVAGNSGVVKWSTTSEQPINSKKSTLKIKNTPTFNDWLKKDTYLRFDFYTDTKVSLTWFGVSDMLIYNYNSDTNSAVKLFDEEGYLIKNSTIWNGELLNKWITFEIKLGVDYNFASEYKGLGMYSSGFTSSANVYLDNIIVSDTAITPKTVTETIILADESDLTAGNMYANKKDLVSLTYVAEEIGGKSGVFKWSTTSETGVNQDKSMLKFSSKFAEQIVTGAYLSFDLYVTSKTYIAWFENGTIYFYNAYGSSSFPPSVKLFDVNGVEIVADGTKGIWNGALTGQWIKVEICLNLDQHTFTSGHRGLGIYDGSHFNDTNPIYLDNVKVSATSLLD